MERWLAAFACATVGCAFTPGDLPGGGDPASGDDASIQPDAPPDAPPLQDFHLRIEGLIDGESHLIIKGTTVHWQHYIYAAPGRWNFVIDPIKLNSVDWYPTWPDVPDTENRDCNGCMSSSTELPIGVPRAASTVTIDEIQVRRAQGIIQLPSAANDWELIVLISDYMVGGSAQYIVGVNVTLN